MIQYQKLIYRILTTGTPVVTRAGACLAVFDARLSFDLSKSFPIVTTKKTNYPAVVDELLWFISGSTNIKDLKFTKIWDEWASDSGDLGPIYGHQWRNLCVDQLAWLVNEIKTNPTSRRLIVSSWNVAHLDLMHLPPCHYAFECYVSNGKLDLKWHQRSVDVMLGLPFNIASYATLLHILALECGLEPGRLIGDLGNCHIYGNHILGAEEVLDREPFILPTLHINKKDIYSYEIADFSLVNYKYRPHIKLEVSV